jgi:hypothetical protein
LSYNHICKNKELLLVMIEEKDELHKEDIVKEVENRTDLEDPMVGLSLQSLIEFTKPKTMKLVGRIEGKENLVLI